MSFFLTRRRYDPNIFIFCHPPFLLQQPRGVAATYSASVHTVKLDLEYTARDDPEEARDTGDWRKRRPGGARNKPVPVTPVDVAFEGETRSIRSRGWSEESSSGDGDDARGMFVGGDGSAFPVFFRAGGGDEDEDENRGDGGHGSDAAAGARDPRTYNDMMDEFSLHQVGCCD